MFFKKKADITPFRRKGLSLNPVGENHRGLFCSETIKTGETIEIAPIMLFNDTDADTLRKTGFGDFLFPGGAQPRGALVADHIRQTRRPDYTLMGAGSFCGRRRDPNAECRTIDAKHTAFYALTALRDIPPGTEICLGYADGKQTADFNPKECGTAPLFSEKPAELFLRGGLYLKMLPEKGRGLFCREDIKEGETIEVCPVLVFDDTQGIAARNTRLYSYIFTAQTLPAGAPARAGITNFDDGSLFAVGLVSYCNHMHVPNAVENEVEDVRSCHFRLSALKDIPAGTEICIDYGLGWLTHQRQWDRIKGKAGLAGDKG